MCVDVEREGNAKADAPVFASPSGSCTNPKSYYRIETETTDPTPFWGASRKMGSENKKPAPTAALRDFRAEIEQQVRKGTGASVESHVARLLLDDRWRVERQHPFINPDDQNSWQDIDVFAEREVTVGGVDAQLTLHISCSSSRKYAWVFSVLDPDRKTGGREAFVVKPPKSGMGQLPDRLPAPFWSAHDGKVAELASGWSLRESPVGEASESRMWEKIQRSVRSVASGVWRMDDVPIRIHVPVVVFGGECLLAEVDRKPAIVTDPDTIALRAHYDIPRQSRSKLEVELDRIRHDIRDGSAHSMRYFADSFANRPLNRPDFDLLVRSRLNEAPRWQHVQIVRADRFEKLLDKVRANFRS